MQWKWIAVLVVLAVVPHSARAVTPRSSGLLVVRCQTKGANVYVDQRLVGTAPLERPIALTPGKHTIKIAKRAYAEYLDVITIKPGKRRVVEIDLLPVAALLRVTSSVSGAQVFVDGRYLGETPIEAEVPMGKRLVELKKQGYFPRSLMVQTLGGQRRDLHLPMEPVPASADTTAAGERDRASRWYERWYVWGGIAAGVAVMALTVTLVATQTGDDPVRDFGPDFTWQAALVQF